MTPGYFSNNWDHPLPKSHRFITKLFGDDIANSKVTGVSMGQEVSISLQAVKTKVYKLIDALIEGVKSEAEVQESIHRWWKLIHPADRAVALKYLELVLQRSCASLAAMNGGLQTLKEFRAAADPIPPKTSKLHVPNQTQISSQL
jgi:hypothetical protein